VYAVYVGKIAEIADPAANAEFVSARRAKYVADVDLERLASDLVIDSIVEPADLRREVVTRLRYAAAKDRSFSDRRHGVPPV